MAVEAGPDPMPVPPSATPAETCLAMASKRIAVVCLVPAAGHLVCLLKIAFQLRGSAAVLVVVPSELKGVAEYYGFEAVAYGSAGGADGAAALQEYAEASEVSRVLTGLRRLERNYLAPLRAAVRDAFPQVDSIIARFDPDVIVADELFFQRELAGLSRKLEKPVIFHSVAPNWERHNTWSLKSCFFRDARTLLLDAWSKSLNEVRMFGRRRSAISPLTGEAEQACLAAVALPPERAPITHVSTGTRFLERALLAERLLYSGEGRVVLPAFPPLEERLPTELLQWLEGSGRPAVYLSLGTLITNSGTVEEIVRGIIESGRRVLVQGAHEALSGRSRRDVRQESWLPQAAALAHPAISLVLSHGGSGTVEEALWYGRPLVCMPHAWDQHYNAWIGSELGVSVTVRKHPVGLHRRVRLAVEKASGSGMTANARAVSSLMRLCWERKRQKVAEFVS